MMAPLSVASVRAYLMGVRAWHRVASYGMDGLGWAGRRMGGTVPYGTARKSCRCMIMIARLHNEWASR
jgi:hypothetical protein